MPRIIGVDIPAKKRILISLQYIYGIGPAMASRLLEQTKINPDTPASELTDDQIKLITNALQQGFVVEGDLRREVQQNIKRLITINCYRGGRHRRGLPVRGQRTRTNARTRKGPKKLASAKKKV